jgi:hypothetical protein
MKRLAVIAVREASGCILFIGTRLPRDASLCEVVTAGPASTVYSLRFRTCPHILVAIGFGSWLLDHHSRHSVWIG